MNWVYCFCRSNKQYTWLFSFFTLMLPAVTQSSNGFQPTKACPAQANSAKKVVQLFLDNVRSGLHPEQAALYMADTVLAHQINAENPVTIKRTPADYTAHVNSFLQLFGKFEFTVTEIIADGDKVYARWIQKGAHIAEIEGYDATGLPLIEYTSAVYRVDNGKIVEYWLQTDRYGMQAQLQKNKVTTSRK